MDALKGEKQQLKQTHLHTSLRLKEKLRLYRQLYKGLHAKATQLHAERQALLLHIRALKADPQSGVTVNPPQNDNSTSWTQPQKDVNSDPTKPSSTLHRAASVQTASKTCFQSAPECSSHGGLRKQYIHPASGQPCPQRSEEVQESFFNVPQAPSHSTFDSGVYCTPLSANHHEQRCSDINYKNEDAGASPSVFNTFFKSAPLASTDVLACSSFPLLARDSKSTENGTNIFCNSGWAADEAAAVTPGAAADGALLSCRLLQERVQQLKRQYEQKQKQGRVGMQVQTSLSPFRKAKVTLLSNIQAATERVPVFRD